MHQEGVQRIISLRGGIRALAGQKYLGPLLNCFLSYEHAKQFGMFGLIADWE